MTNDVIDDQQPLFEVTEAQLLDQLANSTATLDDHLVWLDPEVWVITTDGPRRPPQVAWYLAEGHWIHEDNLVYACDQTGCILHEHLAMVPMTTTSTLHADTEEHIDTLVQQASRPSLAALYRAGRTKGLLTSSPGYQ
jgi:hypothetical protein